MGLDVRQLRYFVGIVEHGSFSKAATHLNVAQPALSQHVRHMEQELGIGLLHRNTHGVVPTEAGSRLITHARAILAELAELEDKVRGCDSSPRGEVRFGLPGTVGEILAVPLLEQALWLFPGVRIRVVETMSGYISSGCAVATLTSASSTASPMRRASASTTGCRKSCACLLIPTWPARPCRPAPA
jgi:LysR family nitrogen assimilation transcriptional regulator